LEVALGAAATWGIGSVLAVHPGEPRYLVVAGALAVFAVALTALHVVLLVRVLRLDHSAPVTDLQRDVERTRLVEYRALKWALLGGCLFWLPVPLVLI